MMKYKMLLTMASLAVLLIVTPTFAHNAYAAHHEVNVIDRVNTIDAFHVINIDRASLNHIERATSLHVDRALTDNIESAIDLHAAISKHSALHTLNTIDRPNLNTSACSNHNHAARTNLDQITANNPVNEFKHASLEVH